MAIEFNANGGYWTDIDESFGEVKGDIYVAWDYPGDNVDEVVYMPFNDPTHDNADFLGWKKNNDNTIYTQNSIINKTYPEGHEEYYYAVWDYYEEDPDNPEWENPDIGTIEAFFNFNNGQESETKIFDYTESYTLTFPTNLNFTGTSSSGFKGWQKLGWSFDYTLYQPGDYVYFSPDEGNLHFLAIWDKINIRANMGDDKTFETLEYSLLEGLYYDEVYGIECYAYKLNQEDLSPNKVPENKLWSGDWYDEEGNYFYPNNIIPAQYLQSGITIYPSLYENPYYDIRLHIDNDYETYKVSREDSKFYLPTDLLPKNENLGGFNIILKNPETEGEINQFFENGYYNLYNFKGWSYSPNGDVLRQDYIEVEGDLDLYAIFEADESNPYIEHYVYELQNFTENQLGWYFQGKLVNQSDKLIPNGEYIAYLIPQYNIIFKDNLGNTYKSLKIQEGNSFNILTKEETYFSPKISNFIYYCKNSITNEIKTIEIPEGYQESYELMFWEEETNGQKYYNGATVTPSKNMSFIPITNITTKALVTPIISELEYFQSGNQNIEFKVNYDIPDNGQLTNEDNVGSGYIEYIQTGWKNSGEEILDTNTNIKYGETYESINNSNYICTKSIIISNLIPIEENFEKPFEGWGKNQNISIDYLAGVIYSGPDNLNLKPVFKSYSVPIFFKDKTGNYWLPGIMYIKNSNGEWI